MSGDEAQLQLQVELKPAKHSDLDCIGVDYHREGTQSCPRLAMRLLRMEEDQVGRHVERSFCSARMRSRHCKYARILPLMMFLLASVRAPR